MTAIADLLAFAAARLSVTSDTPRLDAEVLLTVATGKTRTYFHTWPENHPSPEQQALFQALLERRLEGHPIAYLTGCREFWSREFLVSPDVLIPRPETELLVDLVLQRMAKKPAVRIADLGTGSGILAITLALELPKASVTALDVSSAALRLAEQNARRLGANTVRFLASDWFAALPADERFDVIVSNPPYIAANDPHLRRGDLRFEPLAALASGLDGLDAIRTIINQAPKFLAAGGWLLVEHGYEQAQVVQVLLAEAGFGKIESFHDLQGHRRVSGGHRGED